MYAVVNKLHFGHVGLPALWCGDTTYRDINLSLQTYISSFLEITSM